MFNQTVVIRHHQSVEFAKPIAVLPCHALFPAWASAFISKIISLVLPSLTPFTSFWVPFSPTTTFHPCPFPVSVSHDTDWFGQMIPFSLLNLPPCIWLQSLAEPLSMYETVLIVSLSVINVVSLYRRRFKIVYNTKSYNKVGVGLAAS